MHHRRRALVFTLATILLALIVAWAGRATWRELRQLHRSVAAMHEDAFHLSEHLKASVRELNETMLRFDLHRQPADQVTFQDQCERLAHWIRARQTTITTPHERELFGQIETAFATYRAQTARLFDPGPAGATPARAPQPMLDQLQQQAEPLLTLAARLQLAEAQAHVRFMEESSQALSGLQRLLIFLLVLVVILLLTAALALHRGVIGPLHFELLESRAAAARHEKLAFLGTLAAAVAHEIRNPLTAINVRLHSLKKHLVPGSSEQEDALVIGDEIQRLEHILQEFLQFARPAEPRLLAVSTDRLLARVQALFAPQFEPSTVRLILDSPPDLWVRVDPHQIEQVLINLIQNAAESLGAQGGDITLRVRTRSERLGGRLQPVVLLEVSDTGKGIPPDLQRRIFDPFFTTKETGTGLGLAIAARIVEKHGGRLECRSEVQRGSTFSLVLPRSHPDHAHDSTSRDPAG